MKTVRDKYGRHLFEYRYEDSEWGLEIIARSPEEAKERLSALTWARYKGEIAATIPVPRTLERLLGYFWGAR